MRFLKRFSNLGAVKQFLTDKDTEAYRRSGPSREKIEGLRTLKQKRKAWRELREARDLAGHRINHHIGPSRDIDLRMRVLVLSMLSSLTEISELVEMFEATFIDSVARAPITKRIEQLIPKALPSIADFGVLMKLSLVTKAFSDERSKAEAYRDRVLRDELSRENDCGRLLELARIASNSMYEIGQVGPGSHEYDLIVDRLVVIVDIVNDFRQLDMIHDLVVNFEWDSEKRDRAKGIETRMMKFIEAVTSRNVPSWIVQALEIQRQGRSRYGRQVRECLRDKASELAI